MIQIKKSNIEGLGVFATQNILPNQKIFDYIGIEMTWKEFTAKYGSYKLNSLNTYPMKRIHRIIVAKEFPYKTDNIVNYINEDYDNFNCILKSRALYALKEIKFGEELTLRYPINYNRFWQNINI